MRALDRKLLRDLVGIRAQAAAISLVVATAVALFVGLLTMYQSVRLSQQHYYAEQRFAHVWSSLSRAPRALARDIAALPGVRAADARIVSRALLDVPGIDQPASSLLISIPPHPGRSVDGLYLRRGRYVEPRRRGEVLVNEAFAEKNGIKLGGVLTATIVGGKRIALRVVGIALSPAFVMAIPPGAEINDDRRFAVLWMARDELAALTGLAGAFNDVAVELVAGADERQVIAGLDRLLAPYGGRGAYGRVSNPSHVMLEEHLSPLAPLSILLPSIFLLASAFLTNVVLTRLIATQRQQVGMLKAFGYSNARLMIHYLQLTLAVVVAGTILGLPFGLWLGKVMAEFYAGFFRFPVLIFRVHPAVVVGAGALSLVSAGLGVQGTLRRVVGMPPIVAMTPEVPAFRRSHFGRAQLSRLVPPVGRMIARNLSRRPLRAVLTCVGMALAVAVVVLGESSADGLNRMRDVIYQAQQRADIDIALTQPRRLARAGEFRSLPGVLRAEPYRSVPAKVLSGSGTQDIVLYGLQREAVLRRVVDNHYRLTVPPSDGVVVTAWLAHRFQLKRGDPLALEIRDGRHRVVTTRVVSVVDEPMGLFGYMALHSLNRLLGEPETFSAVQLSTDPAHEAQLDAELKKASSIAAISYRRSSLLSYREMSDASTDFIRQVLMAFSVIIAFGMVYNSARITLAERSRELSTMRVMGFQRAEISRILLGEIAVIALPSMPLGAGLGYLLTGAVAASSSGTRFHMPWLVSTQTYVFSLAVFAVAAAVSALIVRRRLDHLDLLSVLKARE